MIQLTDNYFTHPEIIDVCTSCTSISCKHGDCQRIRDAMKQFKKTHRSRRAHRRDEQYTYRGEAHTLHEWAEILDLKYSTIVTRKHRGLPIEEWFVPTPAQKRGEAHAK